MMRSVPEGALLLLQPKWRGLLNVLRERKTLKRLPWSLLGIGFWALVYYGTLRAVGYLSTIEILGDLFAKKLLGMAFFSLTGFLLLSNIITAISSFYLSRDIPLLRTMPVRDEEILGYKAVETLLNSSWMVLAFTPPILIAYGVSYSSPLYYYPVSIAGLVLFTLVAGGAGMLAGHVLVRIFPARRLRDIILVVSLGVLLGVYFLLRGSEPASIEDPIRFIERLTAFNPETALLPGHWLTESVWAMLKPGGLKDADTLAYLFSLFANAAFMLMASHSAGAAFYQRNLEGIRPEGGTRRRAEFYPGARWALLYKDAKLFIRDTGQWSQVMIIGALALVYVYNFKSLPIAAVMEYSPRIREVLVMLNILMSGMILSAVAARFLYTAVSIEGFAFWAVRSAPVAMDRFLWAKFAYGSIPVALVTTGLVYFANLVLGIEGGLMRLSVGTVLMLSISISGLGVGMGAITPRFKYENIAAVSMSMGGMAFMVAAFSLVTATASAEAIGYYLYYKKGHSALPSIWALGGAVFFLNALALYVPMRTGIKKLERLEQ